MKIQNDPLHALLEQGEAHRKPKVQGDAFESLLNQQLQDAAKPGAFIQNAEQNSAALAMQIRAAQELSGAGNISEEAGKDSDFIFDQMSGLLDKWDMYASSMARPEGANLKSMYGLLNGMTEDLQTLKGGIGNNANLAGLVNELEVLTTTERIKFDRGDYL